MTKIAMVLWVSAALLNACGPRTPGPTPSPPQTAASGAASLPSPSITEVSMLGQGSANDVTWTPDGKELIVGGSLGFSFLDGRTGRKIRHLDLTTDRPYEFPFDISISPDGKQLAFVGISTLWITDLSGGKTVDLLHDMLGWGNQLIYSPDRQKLAFLRHTVSADGFADFWGLSLLDIHSGKIVSELIPESQTQIYAIRLSPDGHILAAASGDNLVYLFDMDTGEKLEVLRGHESDVLDLDFSPDGTYLASVSADATLRMWDVRAGKLVQTVRGFTGGLHFVRFTPDGRYLLAQLPGGGFDEWAIDSTERLSAEHPLFTPEGTVKQMVLQPHGTLLAVLDPMGRLEVWDWSTGKQTQSFLQFGNDVSHLAWSPDGKLIAAASGDCYAQAGLIDLWKTRGRQLSRQLEANGICDLVFSPDGSSLAAFDRSGTILLWDVAAGRETNKFSAGGYSYHNMILAFSPDGQEIAAAGNGLQLWDRNGSKSDLLDDLPGNPVAISFSPDGKTVALATENEIEVWDAKTGSQIAGWKPPEGEIRSAGFKWDPAGTVAVAMGYPSPGFVFHDLLSGRLLYQFNSAFSYGLALSPDGRLLVPIGSDAPGILDAGSGAPLWNSNEQVWKQAAFSPDGKSLATAGYGNAVHLWDTSRLAQYANRTPALTATANPGQVATLTPTATQPSAIEMAELTPPTPQPGAIQLSSLSQLSEFARLGKGGFLFVVWSADGGTFAVNTSIGIYIYRVQPFGEVRFFGLPGAFMTLALSPRGDQLLTGDLKLWDTTSGKLVYQLQAPPADQVQGGPQALRFSPDGNTLQAEYYLDLVCTWNVGQLSTTGCRSEQFTGRPFEPGSVSPDGHLAAYLGSADTNFFNTAQIVDASTGFILLTLKAGDNTPDGVLFSPDGKTLAFISHQETREYDGRIIMGSGRVEIWSINVEDTFTLKHVLEIGRATVGAAPANFRNLFRFSPDGSQLYDVNGESALQVWDVGSGRLRYSLPEAGNVFYASPDGRYLLMSNGLDTVQLWKLNVNRPPTLLQSVDGFEPSGDFLAFSSDGHRLFAGSYPFAEWLIESGSLAETQGGPARTFRAIGRPLAVSLQGDLLAGQVNDGVIQVLNTTNGKVVQSIQAFGGIWPGAAAFSPDGQILASSGGYQSVRLWSVRDGQLVRAIKLGDQDELPTHLVFSPDGHYLAGSGDEYRDQHTVSHTSVEVWDVTNGQQVRFLDSMGSAIAFAPNGFQLVSGRGDGKVFLYDLRTGQTAWTATVGNAVQAVAFSPDGSLLAVDGGGTVQILDAQHGDFLYALPSVSGAGTVRFSPDGKILAVGCSDGTVLLYRGP